MGSDMSWSRDRNCRHQGMPECQSPNLNWAWRWGSVGGQEVGEGSCLLPHAQEGSLE
jgi:hypothetical protein